MTTPPLSKFLPLLIILAVLGIGSGGYFFFKYQQAQQQLQSLKTNTSKAEANALIAEVGKLIELPKDETPTIITISDVTKLKDQKFFQNAKNGNKVLIYQNAKKAILYDPTIKKIIDVASLAQNTIPTPKEAIVSPKAVSIVLRNGTATVGLTNKIEPLIKQSLANASILTKENAGKNDYEHSFLVVLNNAVKTDADKLAKDLGIVVGNLPEGESKPVEGDILIIVGRDKQ